jgi:hypothetical protein
MVKSPPNFELQQTRPAIRSCVVVLPGPLRYDTQPGRSGPALSSAGTSERASLLKPQSVSPTRMDADRTMEWQDLVRRARESLRAESRAPRRHDRVMQVVVLPSSCVYSRYELFVSRDDPENGFVAAYSTWNAESEMKKFCESSRAHAPSA